MLLMKVPVGRVGVPESHPTTARHGLGDGGGGGGGDVGGVGGHPVVLGWGTCGRMDLFMSATRFSI